MQRLQNARNAVSPYNAANCEILLMHHNPASLVSNEYFATWFTGPCSCKAMLWKTWLQHTSSHFSCWCDWYWKLLVYCFVNFDMCLWQWKVEFRVTCDNCHRVLEWRLQRNITGENICIFFSVPHMCSCISCQSQYSVIFLNRHIQILYHRFWC